MKDFNMYQLCKIRIKYNFYNKIANNSTYMYARQMILYLFERGRKDLSNKQKLYEFNHWLTNNYVQRINLQFLSLIDNISTSSD